MIPVFATYFGEELLAQRNDPYYQISLTVEGHACQHDILYKVFGDIRDLYASSTLYGQAGMPEEAKKRQKDGASVGGWFGGRAAVKSGQLAQARKNAIKSTSKPIILTNIKTGEETQYPSLNAAAREIDGSAGALCGILKGLRKSHKGHTARYVQGKI